MTVVPAKYWWLVLTSYFACGLLLGLADMLLGQAAQRMGTRPGVATAVSVNLLLPLATVALAVAFARFGSVWLGALSMTAGLVAGLAFNYTHDYAEVRLASGGSVEVALYIPVEPGWVAVTSPLGGLDDPTYYQLRLPQPMPGPVAEALRNLR